MEQRTEIESVDLEQVIDGVKNPDRLVVIAGGVAMRATEVKEYTTVQRYPNDREWAQMNLIS